jgi:hypothetical protein
MQILIDSSPIAALSPRHRRDLRLSRPEAETIGKVLSADVATRQVHNAVRSQSRLVMILVGGFAVIVLLLLLLAKAPVLYSAALAGGTLAFLVLLRYGYQSSERKWQRTLEARLEGLPPAGTTLRADDAGLRIGADTFPWSELAIVTLNLKSYVLKQGQGIQSYYLVQRLVLQAAGRSFSLDTSMIGNGQGVVDQIYRRLAPPLVP